MHIMVPNPREWALHITYEASVSVRRGVIGDISVHNIHKADVLTFTSACI